MSSTIIPVYLLTSCLLLLDYVVVGPFEFYSFNVTGRRRRTGEGDGDRIVLFCFFVCVGKEEPFKAQEVSDEYLLIKLLPFLLLFPLFFLLFSFFFLSGSAGASPVLLVN